MARLGYTEAPPTASSIWQSIGLDTLNRALMKEKYYVEHKNMSVTTNKERNHHYLVTTSHVALIVWWQLSLHTHHYYHPNSKMLNGEATVITPHRILAECSIHHNHTQLCSITQGCCGYSAQPLHPVPHLKHKQKRNITKQYLLLNIDNKYITYLHTYTYIRNK